MIISLAVRTYIKGITNKMFHEHFSILPHRFFFSSITFIQRLEDVNPKKAAHQPLHNIGHKSCI